MQVEMNAVVGGRLVCWTVTVTPPLPTLPLSVLSLATQELLITITTQSASNEPWARVGGYTERGLVLLLENGITEQRSPDWNILSHTADLQKRYVG